MTKDGVKDIIEWIRETYESEENIEIFTSCGTFSLCLCADWDFAEDVLIHTKGDDVTWITYASIAAIKF